MKRIFAIGGGELRLSETLEIDKKIVEASGKSNPKLLFIPTASGEPMGYVDSIQNIYGSTLGCNVETLFLLNKKLSKESIRETNLNSNMIYVGDGKTKFMMQVWRENDVDTILIEAYNKGIILSGLSAGSICWFESGHSDSDTYESGEKCPYIKVKGLGLLPFIHCPHYDEDDRADDFDQMINETNEIGIAIENNCAIEIYDDMYRILKSNKNARAFKVYKSNSRIVKEEIYQSTIKFLMYC